MPSSPAGPSAHSAARTRPLRPADLGATPYPEGTLAFPPLPKLSGSPLIPGTCVFFLPDCHYPNTTVFNEVDGVGGAALVRAGEGGEAEEEPRSGPGDNDWVRSGNLLPETQDAAGRGGGSQVGAVGVPVTASCAAPAEEHTLMGWAGGEDPGTAQQAGSCLASRPGCPLSHCHL